MQRYLVNSKNSTEKSDFQHQLYLANRCFHLCSPGSHLCFQAKQSVSNSNWQVNEVLIGAGGYCGELQCPRRAATGHLSSLIKPPPKPIPGNSTCTIYLTQFLADI